MLRAKKHKSEPTNRDRQRWDTRLRLINAARELIDMHGVEGLSVKEIGEVAGVSHAMVYAYYGDKAGLLKAIFAENNVERLPAARRIATSSGSAMERLRKVLVTFARFDFANPDLYAAMQAHSWTSSEQEKSEDCCHEAEEIAVIADLIREAVAHSEIASLSDTERAAKVVLSLYSIGVRNSVLRKTSIISCVREIWPSVEMLLRPAEATKAAQADAKEGHLERG